MSPNLSLRAASHGSTEHSTVGVALPAQAVTLLSPQIPEFGGTEDENALGAVCDKSGSDSWSLGRCYAPGRLE